MAKKSKKTVSTNTLKLNKDYFIIPCIEYSGKQNIESQDLRRLAFIDFCEDGEIVILPDSASGKKLTTTKIVEGSKDIMEDKRMLSDFILQNFQSRENKVLVEYNCKKFNPNAGYRISFKYETVPNEEFLFKGYVEDCKIFCESLAIKTNLNSDSYLRFLFCTSDTNLAKRRLLSYILFNFVGINYDKIPFYIYKKNVTTQGVVKTTQTYDDKSTLGYTKRIFISGKEVEIVNELL